MDFDFTEEQRLLDETVRRLVKDEYDIAKRKAYIAEPEGFSRKLWQRYAELGLLGLPFAEAEGGFGGSAVETMIVMESCGRGLVVEPYLASVVLGGGFVTLAGSAAQKRAILPALAGGKLLLAFAHGERQSRYTLNDVETSAKKDGGGYVLNGKKGVVLHGDSADRLIVSARSSGASRERKGLSLFIVDATAKGVSRRGYPTVDGLRAAEVTLDQVRVEGDALLGSLGEAYPVIEHAIDRAIAALAAEAVGIMETLNATTLDYLKTRKQFGVPIGSFQALQHRMADMVVEYEQARSMATLAALCADLADAQERRRVISAAKVQIGKSGRFVGQQAIQLHGGIGMTDEYSAGHYFKRLTMIDQTFGDADHHLDRFAEVSLPSV
ncbi:MAG TPA: acyl-CoA dehydrogenase family protein [Stellaceae bacterium]|nr:acyl-CoA dehydrogenase family protein [Stellaceae bacterium]